MKEKVTISTVLLVALLLIIAPTILASERVELTASISGTQHPTVSLSATTLVFRYYPRCITGPLTRTVTLTNDGPGVLDISRIAITNGPYADFSQTHTCGSTLGVGDSCGITVTWHPEGNNASGSLLITDNGVGSPQRVQLEGSWLCLK